jgi:hypothetical protein
MTLGAVDVEEKSHSCGAALSVDQPVRLIGLTLTYRTAWRKAYGVRHRATDNRSERAQKDPVPDPGRWQPQFSSQQPWHEAEDETVRVIPSELIKRRRTCAAAQLASTTGVAAPSLHQPPHGKARAPDAEDVVG